MEVSFISSPSRLLHQVADQEILICREEQHDDQVLHELLRAFKALTLTSVRSLTLVSK